ncbi:MAG: PQQ-dependent sugar dehydrogenase [Labrys sp. (in: a-proteobacteria)]
MSRPFRLRSLLAGGFAVALLHTGAFAADGAAPAAPTAKPKIASVLGSVEVTVFDLPIEDNSPSGPMEVLGNDRFLFVTACGDGLFMKRSGDTLATEATFSLNTVAKEAKREPVFCEGNGSGVKDSVIIDGKLYLAHHVFDFSDNKAYMVVREFVIGEKGLTFSREILRVTPGVNEPYMGLQSGGRMAYDGRSLLIALGDFGKPRLTREDGSLLGKLVRVNLKTLKHEVVSAGLRSPTGGLFHDAETGLTWETEHGPRGGDEINLIKPGKHYGWPEVSYGTNYEREGYGDYYGNNFNTHENYEKPRYVFVPSIGIGTLAKYPKTGPIEYWHGDYFMAGMATNTLYRVRIEGDRVVYVEPVMEGFRIRDIAIGKDGVIYMKTDDARLVISDSKKPATP